MSINQNTVMSNNSNTNNDNNNNNDNNSNSNGSHNVCIIMLNTMKSNNKYDNIMYSYN